MTWFDKPHAHADRAHRKVHRAVFAERAPTKKLIPAWIADQQRTTSSLSGWLSTRPGPRPSSVAPPPEPKASRSAFPPVAASAEAIEAQALSFEQHRVPMPAIPQSPPLPFESLAERLPESAVLLASVHDERLDAAISALERSIADLASLRARTLDETEEQLVVLAAAIARKVIGREISIDRGAMLALAAEGIEALGERDRILVRIGGFEQTDAAAMLERLRKKAPRCDIVVDDSLGLGECIVESELGQVDESIDARLSNVLSATLPRPGGAG